MIIENNFKLYSILLIMGVLNEKMCKELLFGSSYSFENIYVTFFLGFSKWFDDSFLKNNHENI
jgi:hypothetical protein